MAKGLAYNNGGLHSTSSLMSWWLSLSTPPAEGGEEEELPAIGASPVPAVGRERVPTPRVSTTRTGMQEHRLD